MFDNKFTYDIQNIAAKVHSAATCRELPLPFFIYSVQSV